MKTMTRQEALEIVSFLEGSGLEEVSLCMGDARVRARKTVRETQSASPTPPADPPPGPKRILPVTRKRISRILVANRGEIALRILRACRELDVESVLAVSEADRESLPARMADRVVCIGPPASMRSYLRLDTLVAAALDTRAEAIHPGYGFLAEQPAFPEACEKHGLVFVGPRADQIRQMGDKVWARRMAQEIGVPVIPGSGQVQGPAEAAGAADGLGYPVLIKAAAGGGGRGMKVARDAKELGPLLLEAAAEARTAFGDDRLYLEKYLSHARHVEVQIMGDGEGRVVHLFERDCSLQRRHQKMVEEAPCPVLTPAQRKALCDAAVAIARHISYESAGTVEFIWDQDGETFYFLEMNTRIQVEHPVTEMVTGIDLVREQIRLAGGEGLSFRQEDIACTGHAIECRITAESPEAGFRPSPGRIREWAPPYGPDIRVDSHCFSGYEVPPYYDSLLAKLIVRGDSRPEAIERMLQAIALFRIAGIDTTLPFHETILKTAEFREARVHTRWIEEDLMMEKGL
jgi:acetyl-CoA carboxylase, biotin carboxylase subunit